MLLKVRENYTGILFVSHPNRATETYLPRRSLEKAREVLIDFYNLRNSQGLSVKDAFKDQDTNWFPVTVSFLYWRLFYPYVQYGEFIQRYPGASFEMGQPQDGMGTRFKDFIGLLQQKDGAFRPWMSRILCKIINAHNKKVLSLYPDNRLLFYEFRLNNFRTSGLINALDTLKVPFLRALSEKRRLLKNLFSPDKKPYFISLYPPTPCAAPTFIPANLPTGQVGDLYKAAVFHVHRLTRHCRESRNYFADQLRESNIKILFGMDDLDYSHALVMAARDCGIRTVGYQHGAYSRQQAAYIMEGFGSDDYSWYKEIWVWGKFWQQMLQDLSSYYPAGVVRVARNKHKYDPCDPKSIGPNHSKGILIPYEFLGDTEKIGRYIVAFQEKGYKIFFKARTDEPVAGQIDSYMLPPAAREQIVVIEEINDPIMANISIIAGTYTALIYDLLPYRKEIWILDTEFCMTEELLRRGAAKLVRLEHIDADIQKPSPSIPPEFVGEVFNSASLPEAVSEILSAN